MSPISPHFLNQAPPRAQQVNLPDFLAVPHLGHALVLLEDTAVVVEGDSMETSEGSGGSGRVSVGGGFYGWRYAR